MYCFRLILKVLVVCIILISFAGTVFTHAANWWNDLGEPEYGGSITLAGTNIEPNFDSADPRGAITLQYDGLFVYDWTADPSIHPYKNEFVTPEYHRGLLAEKWEQTDPLTITVNLRQGVHWQDKPPVNGREFTAEDVVYNFDRVLGTGSGFTEPNPFIAGIFPDIDKVVAIDKYTVQFKLKDFTCWTIYQILTTGAPGGFLGMVAPEWVQHGDLKNWKNVVGTGPWVVTDFVSGSSVTFSRNPDYWGYDERYPKNKLPYADILKILVISDMATQLAGLRTGKVDLITDRRAYPSWQQVESIKKSNPEIQSSSYAVDGYSVDLRGDKKPFTDIKVRKALQLAIDLGSIAQHYYGGTVDGVPCGLMNPINAEWVTPYDQWPKELQEEYSYNPNKAKELLAEAGYPDGFDTTCAASDQDDRTLLQLIKSQFMEINVNMEIEVYDNPTFMNYCSSGKNEQMDFFVSTAIAMDPLTVMAFRTTDWRNFTKTNDAYYNSLYEQIVNAPDLEKAKALVKKADMYALEQHWSVHLFGLPSNMLWQPYFKGFTGQYMSSGSPFFARLWIDKDLKGSMGY